MINKKFFIILLIFINNNLFCSEPDKAKGIKRKLDDTSNEASYRNQLYNSIIEAYDIHNFPNEISNIIADYADKRRIVINIEIKLKKTKENFVVDSNSYKYTFSLIDDSTIKDLKNISLQVKELVFLKDKDFSFKVNLWKMVDSFFDIPEDTSLFELGLDTFIHNYNDWDFSALQGNCLEIVICYESDEPMTEQERYDMNNTIDMRMAGW